MSNELKVFLNTEENKWEIPPQKWKHQQDKIRNHRLKFNTSTTTTKEERWQRKEIKQKIPAKGVQKRAVIGVCRTGRGTGARCSSKSCPRSSCQSTNRKRTGPYNKTSELAYSPAQHCRTFSQCSESGSWSLWGTFSVISLVGVEETWFAWLIVRWIILDNLSMDNRCVNHTFFLIILVRVGEMSAGNMQLLFSRFSPSARQGLTEQMCGV